MTDLLDEFKRRGVLRVAATYAVVSWILIEAGSVLLPTFGASDWVFRSYVIVVIIGFLVSLITAWFFQMTTDGVQRELSAEQFVAEAPATKSGVKSNRLIVIMLILALCISVALNILGLRNPTAVPTGEKLSIAVLPFTNLSTDPENVGFVDGIHDDLLTKLANLESMQVISRTSVLSYRDTIKNLSQIGRELGVNSIVEGSIQRSGNNVKINVQLINAATDEHLWAQTYNRKITAKNIFDIQSEITSKISTALKATLSPDEQNRMNSVPTENLAAYRLFVEGRQNLHQRRLNTLLVARDQFEQAINLDSQYADAYVGLADSILLLNINHNAIPSPLAYQLVQTAIDKALEISPQHAEAFATQGLLYSQQSMHNSDNSKMELAETFFQKALKLNPSNASAWMWYASTKVGQNDTTKALEFNQKSLQLDPLAKIPYLNIPKLYASTNRNNKAIKEFLRGVEIQRDWPDIYYALSNHLQKLGRLDEALGWLTAGNQINQPTEQQVDDIGIFFQVGLQDEANNSLQQVDPSNPIVDIVTAYTISIKDGPKQALAYLQTKVEQNTSPMYYFDQALSEFSLLSGDLETARGLIFKIHPELRSDEPELNSYNSSAALKLAYIAQKSESTNTRDTTQQLENILAFVIAQPRLGIAGLGIQDVQTLAMLGQTGSAVDAFEQAVAQGFNNTLSYDGWTIKDDPYLHSIKQHPKFIEQLEIIEERLQVMRENIKTALKLGDLSSLKDITLEKSVSNN